MPSRWRRSGPRGGDERDVGREREAVIEESGLGAKVKKLMPFGGSGSNRDDALNVLAEATKETSEGRLGAVASHLPTTS